MGSSVLPVEIKNWIREVEKNRQVSDEKLVIEKQLREADVNLNQNRLSIPMKHIKEELLTVGEYRLLYKHDTGKMEVENVSLRRWEMKKENGPPIVSFVLTRTWNNILVQMDLRNGMTFQLWSFRVDGELVFALKLLG